MEFDYRDCYHSFREVIKSGVEWFIKEKHDNVTDTSTYIVVHNRIKAGERVKVPSCWVDECDTFDTYEEAKAYVEIMKNHGGNRYSETYIPQR